jgi:hypothetical protein
MNYPFLVTFELVYKGPDSEDRLNTRHHIEAIDEYTAIAKAALRLARKFNREREQTKIDSFSIISANVKEL